MGSSPCSGVLLVRLGQGCKSLIVGCSIFGRTGVPNYPESRKTFGVGVLSERGGLVTRWD